jgi:DNA-binding HxlR family transcriptional regulator
LIRNFTVKIRHGMGQGLAAGRMRLLGWWLMKRKSFEKMDCPVALALERVGEWWSILILRDAMQGYTKFDDFRQSLGISPTMLTRRLNTLVKNGLLERRRYSKHPPRDEYILTPEGRDFDSVLIALFAWGTRHADGRKLGIALVDKRTGVAANPVVIDRDSREPITAAKYRFVVTKNASAATRRRLLEHHGGPISS